jgi:cytoskeletal protein CcmA (bactofilin family)
VSCPGEAVLAAHADGELSPEEARAVEAHLPACPGCRRLLEALRGENRLLARVLEEGAFAEPAAPQMSWADLATAGLALLAAAAGAQGAWRWLGSLGEQAPFGLLDTRSLAWSVVFDTFFFLLREGAAMLNSFLTVLGFLASVVAAAALGLVLQRRRRMPGTLLLAGLLACSAPAATALERRTAEKGNVTIPAGETIDDTLFAAGETVSVDGVVTGNLLAFAHHVIVKGTVKGDLITAAQRVEVSGTVEGNVFGAGEEVWLQGAVHRSVHACAKRVAIAAAARIEGDAIAFARDAELDGGFGRDVLAFSETTSLRGVVARHATAWTDRLDVEAGAQVGGKLTAHVHHAERVRVAPGSSVAGKLETRLPRKQSPRSPYARPSFYVWKAIWLAAAFVTGLALRRLAPTLFAYRPADAGALAKPLGIGFLVFAATPVGIVLLGLTVVGLPLALLALAAWLAGLYVSGILVGAFVGWTLLARRAAPPPFALALLLGLLVVGVAANVPYLGGLVRLVAILLGLGIGAVQLGRAWRSAPAV